MRHSFLLLILLTFNTIVQAQSLEECRELAKKNYPEIKQYDLISKTEQFNLSNAVRSWIPQVAEILTLNQGLEQILASKATYRKMLEIFIGQEPTSDTLQRPSIPQISERVSMRPELSLFDSKINKINAQMKMINTFVYPRFNAFAQAYYGYPEFYMLKV